MSVSINGTGGITFADASTQSTGGYTGFRNRIINGAMMISQRGTSFSAPAAGTYTLDRWSIGWGGAAPATVAQVSGPTGYKNAIQVTGAASNTLIQVIQRVESYNCSDLSGATVTLQANIAVSSSQTVRWALKYATAQDNFTTTTTISSGTWSATSTATTFTATISNLPSSAVNGLQVEIYPNNAGAFTSGTITITGVQLEKGSVATPFEFRPYGTELALCQRYFSKTYNTATAVGTASTFDGCVDNIANTTVTYVLARWSLPVTMRATPTFTTYSPVTGTSGKGYSNAPAGDFNAAALNAGATNCSFSSGGTSIAATGYVAFQITASAEL